MKLEVDSHVAKIAYFMTRIIPAYKLQSVAHGLAQLSDLIWAHHVNRPVKFRLCSEEWNDEGDTQIVDELLQLNINTQGLTMDDLKRLKKSREFGKGV